MKPRSLENIGRGFGQAIARGETAQGLEALAEVAATTVDRESARARAAAAVAGLRGAGFTPTVLVVNSWRLRHEVVRDVLAPDDEGRCGDVDSAPAFFEYADAPDQILVADFDKAIELRRLPLSASAPWERLLENGRLVAGVAEIDQIRAEEMIDRNEDLRRGPNGCDMTIEDAVLSLRQRVEAKAHTRFEWVVLQPEAIRRFDVASSDE